MLTFAAGIIENNQLRPIILQSAKVGIGEKSEDTVEIMKEILEDSKEYLEWLKEICEREFPYFKYDIPPSSAVTLSNCKTSVISSDCCNQAQKIRRLMKDDIEKEIREGNSTIILFEMY